MRAKQVFKPLDLLRVFLFCRMLCPLIIIMLICSAGYGNHAATMGKRGPAAAKTQADGGERVPEPLRTSRCQKTGSGVPKGGPLGSRPLEGRAGAGARPLLGAAWQCWALGRTQRQRGRAAQCGGVLGVGQKCAARMGFLRRRRAGSQGAAPATDS